MGLASSSSEEFHYTHAFLMGHAWLVKRRPNDAVQAFTEALRRRPDSAEAYYGMALAWKDLDVADKAETAFTQAARRDPALGRQPAECFAPAFLAPAYYRRAACAMRKGHLAPALVFYQRAHALAPNDPAIAQELVTALENSGDQTAAKDVLEHAKAHHPDQSWPHVIEGIHFIRSGQKTDAETAFRRALALDPATPWASVHLGYLLAGQGRLDEAIIAFEAATASQPAVDEPWLALGSLHLQLLRPTEARAALEQARKRHPNNPMLHYHLACAALVEGDIGMAAAALEQTLVLAPHFAQAQSLLGLVLQQRGDGEAAGACHRQALQHGGDLGRILCHQALWLLERGQTREAEAQIRRGVELEPETGWSHLCHAQFLHRQGRHDDANAARAVAARLQPWLMPLQDRLALTLFRPLA